MIQVTDSIHQRSQASLLARAMLLLASSSFTSLALAADIDGRWVTFDQSTGHKRSMVEIKRQSNQFTGRIVELFIKSGEPSDPVCGVCPGAQQGKKIRGLEILNLSRAGNEIGYTGTILDPEEGHSYKCIATLDATGKRITIRGYVGIPLLGRTVVWERVE